MRLHNPQILYRIRFANHQKVKASLPTPNSCLTLEEPKINKYCLIPAELKLNSDQIVKETGFAYQFHCPGMPVGDDQDFPTLSRLKFFEDGKLLEPHKQHALIREVGRGTYSHWNTYILFSTSDNSDPRNNGRQYILRDPMALVLDHDLQKKFENILNYLCKGQNPADEVNELLKIIKPNRTSTLLRCITEVLFRTKQNALANHYLQLAWKAGDHSSELLSLFATQSVDKIEWDEMNQSLLSSLQVPADANNSDYAWYGGYTDAVSLTLFGEYRPKTKEFLTMHALFGQSAYEGVHLYQYMQQLIEVRKDNFMPSIRDLYVYAMAILMQSSAQAPEFADFGCTLFETIDRLAICEARYRKGLLVKQMLFLGIEPSALLAETAKMLHSDYRLNIYSTVTNMPKVSGRRIESSYQATSYGFRSTEALWGWIQNSDFSCSQIWFSTGETDQTHSINGKRLTLFSYPKLRAFAETAGFIVKTIESQILKNKDWSILEITLAVISKDTLNITENNSLFHELGLKLLSTYSALNVDALISNARVVDQYPDHGLATGTSDKLDFERSKKFHLGLLNHLAQLCGEAK